MSMDTRLLSKDMGNTQANTQALAAALVTRRERPVHSRSDCLAGAANQCRDTLL